MEQFDARREWSETELTVVFVPDHWQLTLTGGQVLIKKTEQQAKKVARQVWGDSILSSGERIEDREGKPGWRFTVIPNDGKITIDE